MRSAFIALSILTLVFTSCESCMTCSYTYTSTEIIQTLNGEEEVTTEHSGVLSDSTGETFSQECIKENKGEQFTIEQFYQNKADTTVLDNFQVTCTPQ